MATARVEKLVNSGIVDTHQSRLVQSGFHKSLSIKTVGVIQKEKCGDIIPSEESCDDLEHRKDSC